jgi:hypothetical protein
MAQRVPRPGEQIPEEYRRDLNPNALAGENVGEAGPHPEWNGPTAFDVKEVNRRLQGFADDELKQIPILPTGSRLEQGATYIDLNAPGPVCTEFTATGDMIAGPTNLYVPKDSVGYVLWNRLRGVTNPERLDERS